MYKILIIDDEPFIADGLVRFIENLERSDLDVYKGYSAEEALEWLNRTKIDIVISDIQMPGMNGLQLLEEINRKWPLCKVIFLTGYNEFEYAYTAVQYNVVSYILKSEGDEEILKAIEKCISEIEKTIINEELIKKAHDQINRSLPLLQREYLMDILQGEKASVQIMQKHFDELRIPLNASEPVLLLVGRIDNYSSCMTFSEKTSYLTGVEVAFQEYLGEQVVSVSIAWERRFILWIIQRRSGGNCKDDEDCWPKTIVFIKGTLENIQQTCKRTLGISLSLILDSKAVAWDEIEERYYIMKQMVKYKIGTGVEMCLSDIGFYDSESHQYLDGYNSDTKMAVCLEKLDLLKTYLESGLKCEFFDLLNDEIEYLFKYGKSNYYLCIEIYDSIRLILLSYINKHNLHNKVDMELGLKQLLDPNEAITSKESFEYFYKLSEFIFNYQINQQNDRFNNLIFKLHKYISENIKNDLSLVTLSEKVFLNPAYLSRVYKQITGKNLSEYITNLRVMKAKELLRNDNMKINEISLSVGYESAAHFIRVFKKATGMTPQEYRDSINARKI